MSALAQYYLSKSHKVSGSDLISSEILGLLKKAGVEIFIGPHLEKNLPKDADLVVYSPAVRADNPEIKRAKKLKIKIQSYPEALGELTQKHFTIAVSGTHGKSTTAAMLSLVLTEAGIDPTVIIGTKLEEFSIPKQNKLLKNAKGTNFKSGESHYLIIEADEWNASFLDYWPKIIVLTNIEKEHLDYYKDLDHILDTYKEYTGHLPGEGILVANGDDKNVLKVALSISRQIKKFSLKQKEARILRKKLKVPGEHNVYNALAVLTVARILRISDDIIFKALSKYEGAWRRFEIKDGKINGKKITIVSDYAHHPTEVKATLEAARQKFPKKKIWCVFQPHQGQRTFYLFEDFVKVLSSVPVDSLIVTDIYDVAGREKRKIGKQVSSKKLVGAINHSNVIFLSKRKVKGYLKKNLKGGEAVIIMGAGDIFEMAEEFST